MNECQIVSGRCLGLATAPWLFLGDFPPQTPPPFPFPSLPRDCHAPQIEKTYNAHKVDPHHLERFMGKARQLALAGRIDDAVNETNFNAPFDDGFLVRRRRSSGASAVGVGGRCGDVRM